MAEDASVLESPTGSRRGHPVRIRKPNPRIFGDDDEYVPKAKQLRKPSKVTQPKAVLTTPDKRAAQAIGVRLRNLLKLPKAHKWVCYEWFYSNIDLPLFEGENDFCICLKESFPQLKTKKLRRAEWCKIRRLMGKPRRCSAAFFAEERAVLQGKRHKIRMLQQRKGLDIDLKDLPEEIPMPLVIGTKVTARLRRPQDGLFTGVIDALDTVTNTYRVTFDRPGLGTHSIPDSEVLGNEPQETMPLSAFQVKPRPQRPHMSMLSPPRFLPGLGSPTPLENDPLLGSSPLKGRVFTLEGGTYGGFPIKFLVLVTRLTKILGIKKECVKNLKDMNTEAEKMKSYGKAVPMHFQQKYAATVLELERLNKDLNEYLVGVQQYCLEQLTPEAGGVALVDQPSEVKSRCDNEAQDIVRQVNLQHGRKMVKNEKMLDLVGKLTSILLQVKTFTENDMHSFEFKSLQDSLKDISAMIDSSNASVFQNNVEIHINHIHSGLTQMGNLHAFASSSTVV